MLSLVCTCTVAPIPHHVMLRYMCWHSSIVVIPHLFDSSSNLGVQGALHVRRQPCLNTQLCGAIAVHGFLCSAHNLFQRQQVGLFVDTSATEGAEAALLDAAVGEVDVAVHCIGHVIPYAAAAQLICCTCYSAQLSSTRCTPKGITIIARVKYWLGCISLLHTSILARASNTLSWHGASSKGSVSSSNWYFGASACNKLCFECQHCACDSHMITLGYTDRPTASRPH
jgi:hypothetical protein